MAIELYWGSGSPFVWRVMLTLEVKGLRMNRNSWSFPKANTKRRPIFGSIHAAKFPLSKMEISSSTSRWQS